MTGLDEFLSLTPEEKEARGIVFTPSEIAQQPGVWRRTAKILQHQTAKLMTLVVPDQPLLLTGAGSSYYVARIAEAALIASVPGCVRSVPSTEIVLAPDLWLPQRRFTLVSFARSGNSPEGNAAFELAERLRPGKVRHIVITCNPDGRLAALARQTQAPAALLLLPPESHDRGLAMTSSFTGMLVAALGLADLEHTDTYVRAVDALAAAGETLLDRQASALQRLASYPFARAFFVGSGPLFGAALESHLKVQELTDGLVIGKAEDTLGLRHGPMAAIDSRTLVVLFSSGSAYCRRYEADLLRELAAKDLGLARVVVGQDLPSSWQRWAHHMIDIGPFGSERLPDAWLSVLMVVAAQAIGLFKALSLGLKPDAPSGAGVINRVVQGVTIYPYG